MRADALVTKQCNGVFQPMASPDYEGPMSEATALLMQARKLRDAARRARRLVCQLPQDADRDRLVRYAEELEARASKVVERQAAALAPRAGAPNAGAAIERQQQQPQQQQGAEPASPTDQKPKR